MGRAIRERLSFANVMSVIAVFIALGGGAYALSRGDVKSKHIAKNAIKSKHVKPDKLTGDDINEDSLGTVPRASFANDAAELDGIPAFFYQLGNGFDDAIAGFLEDGATGGYPALGGDVEVTCDNPPTVVWDDLGGDGGTPTDFWIHSQSLNQYAELSDGSQSVDYANNADIATVHAWAGDDTISIVHVSVIRDTAPDPDECRVAFTAQEHFNSLSGAAQVEAMREQAERRRAHGATGLEPR